MKLRMKNLSFLLFYYQNKLTNSYTFSFPCSLLSLSYVRYDNIAPSLQLPPVDQLGGVASYLGWQITQDTIVLRRALSGRPMICKQKTAAIYVSISIIRPWNLHTPQLFARVVPNCTPWRKQSRRQTIVSTAVRKLLFMTSIMQFYSLLSTVLLVYLVCCNDKTWTHNKKSYGNTHESCLLDKKCWHLLEQKIKISIIKKCNTV